MHFQKFNLELQILKKKLYSLIILVNLQYNKNVSILLGMMKNVKYRIKNCFYNRTIRTNLISNEDHQTEIRKEKLSQHVHSRNNAKSNYHALRVTATVKRFSLCLEIRIASIDQTTNVDYLRNDDDAPILSLFSQ